MVQSLLVILKQKLVRSLGPLTLLFVLFLDFFKQLAIATTCSRSRRANDLDSFQLLLVVFKRLCAISVLEPLLMLLFLVFHSVSFLQVSVWVP